MPKYDFNKVALQHLFPRIPPDGCLWRAVCYKTLFFREFGRLKCGALRRLKCAIFEGLKCVIFGRLKYLVFVILKYFSFREIEICCAREIEMFHFWEIELCHSWRLKYVILEIFVVLRRFNCVILGDWNMLFLRYYNISIFGRLKFVFSGDQLCNFRKIKMFFFRGIEHDLFGELKCNVFGKWNI